jgi:hypothetical protein
MIRDTENLNLIQNLQIKIRFAKIFVNLQKLN